MTFKDQTESNYNSFINTQELIKNNSRINSSLDNVEISIFDNIKNRRRKKKYSTEVLINNESTIENILKYKNYRKCALVFSNGILSNYTGKHNTQEDSILRGTNLYPLLDQRDIIRDYYLPNKNSGYLRTNNTMYIKSVLVFKNENVLLNPNNWVNTDFIFSTPPDLSNNDIDIRLNENIIYNRLKNVFDIALKNKITVLILGAYGCGSKNNSPKLVSKVFKRLIIEYDGYFKKIVFGIKSKDFSDVNYNTFYRIIMNS